MQSDDLDVDVIETTVTVDVLDACVREMHMPVEVGQVALSRPIRNLRFIAIWPAVAVCTTAIPLLQEPLVLALQLVVQDNAFDPRAALLEALGLAFVRAVDLHVVLDFAGLLKLGVEALPRLRIATTAAGLAILTIAAMRFQQIPSAIGQNDRDVAMTVDRNRADETLLAEVTEVASARIHRTAVAVAQVARRDDPECPDDAQSAGFGTAKLVLSIAVANDLALQSAW